MKTLHQVLKRGWSRKLFQIRFPDSPMWSVPAVVHFDSCSWNSDVIHHSIKALGYIMQAFLSGVKNRGLTEYGSPK